MRTIFIIILTLIFASCGFAQSESGEVVKEVMDNGLTVLVKPEEGSSLVSIAVFVRAGAAQETSQTAGIGAFVANLILASTKVKSAEQVASIADEVGGNMSVVWHEDYTEIRAITTTAKFGAAMSLIGESVTQANFEQQWVDTVRENLLAALESENDDIFRDAYVKLRSMLYKDNGYRREMAGNERVLRMAMPYDLQKYYSTYYVPNNMVISIVGDVSVKDALNRVSIAFAGTNAIVLPRDRGVPDETLEKSSYFASEVDLSAAYLLVGWLAPSANSPDYAAMNVAVNALGGGKGSMMFREIRQGKGMGYDIGTMYPSLRYQSHVLAYIVTDPFKTYSDVPVLDEVKEALLEQVEILKTTPLSERDLERAKGYTIGKFALEHQRMFDRAFYLGWFEAIGKGYEADKTYIDDLAKVTAEDVLGVANKYFTNYSMVLLLPNVRENDY